MRYELSMHLGNFSGGLCAVWGADGREEVESAREDIGIGVNGNENDNEVKGEENSLDFGAKVYDPRVGKFLSVDPWDAKYPYQSPYLFAYNSPISLIDFIGLGDPPNPEVKMATRHFISDVQMKNSSIDVNSVITNPNWQTLESIPPMYEEYAIAKSTGVKSSVVSLANGTKWNISLHDGHFFPVSGDGIINLTDKEMSLLRNTKSGGKATGIKIFENIKKSFKVWK